MAQAPSAVLIPHVPGVAEHAARYVCEEALLGGPVAPAVAAATAQCHGGSESGASDRAWRALALALAAGEDVAGAPAGWGPHGARELDSVLDDVAHAWHLVEGGVDLDAPSAPARPVATAVEVLAWTALARALCRMLLFEPAETLLRRSLRATVAASPAPPAGHRPAATAPLLPGPASLASGDARRLRLAVLRVTAAARFDWAVRLDLLGTARVPGPQSLATGHVPEGASAADVYSRAAAAALASETLACAPEEERSRQQAAVVQAWVLQRVVGTPAAVGLAAAAVRALPLGELGPLAPAALLVQAHDRSAAGDPGAAARVARRAGAACRGPEGRLWEDVCERTLARLAEREAPPGVDLTWWREIAASAGRRLWTERAARLQDLRQRMLHRRLDELSDRTARQLLEDPLTGVGNRRLLERELDRAGLGGVVFLDVDSFKRINDECGHLVGDRVLRRVAAILRSCCRSGDVVVRYGGDEFVVVLQASPPSAAALGSRVLARVRAEDWSAVTGGMPVTVSVGTADAATVLAALRRSDAAMLAAKRAGRDALVQL